MNINRFKNISYGYAKISKTQQEEISNFIRDYLLARGGLKLVLLLIDPRREVLQSDLDMLEVYHLYRSISKILLIYV